MIPRLGDAANSPFPPVHSALKDPDGLLAWGGDLDPERLIQAYLRGIFPWYSQGQPILWWSPSKRCVIVPDQLHVSRRLARTIRKKDFRITADLAFADVVSACAAPGPQRTSTWITSEIASAYMQLHVLGLGHSIEIWRGDHLVGGIYGLSMGGMFFGESMFSAGRDGSKLALVALCRAMQRWSFDLLDCQIPNPHLLSLGAVSVPREQFLKQLQFSLEKETRTGSWTNEFANV